MLAKRGGFKVVVYTTHFKTSAHKRRAQHPGPGTKNQGHCTGCKKSQENEEHGTKPTVTAVRSD
jgi:hypothetical protein